MTERIFEVEISNKTSKGYETATALEMPATWAEFHDALEKARIKDARDCHNELTKIEYPGIQRGMIGDNVNLYELNLLAQRLAMLSEDDRMGLDGLLQIEGGRHIGPIPLPRLINLTYNADICLLAPHVFNNQQLGALLYESGMLTQEAMTLLDTTEDGSAYRKDLLEVFGKQYQEDHGGCILAGAMWSQVGTSKKFTTARRSCRTLTAPVPLLCWKCGRDSLMTLLTTMI